MAAMRLAQRQHLKLLLALAFRLNLKLFAPTRGTY